MRNTHFLLYIATYEYWVVNFWTCILKGMMIYGMTLASHLWICMYEKDDILFMKFYN